MRWFTNNKPAGQKLAIAWEVRSRKLLTRLEKMTINLRSLQDKLRALSDRMEVELRQAESMQRDYEVAMESLRGENRVLTESTIPALVNSHELILKRQDAEVALQTHRQVALSSREQLE